MNPQSVRSAFGLGGYFAYAGGVVPNGQARFIVDDAGRVIAATGGTGTSLLNGIANQRAELFKAESARILEAIQAGDPEKAKANLKFLSAAGLIEPSTSEKIQDYLAPGSLTMRTPLCL